MTVYSKVCIFISSRDFFSKTGSPLRVVTVLGDNSKTLEFFADPTIIVSDLDFGDPVLLTFNFNGRGLYLTNIALNG